MIGVFWFIVGNHYVHCGVAFVTLYTTKEVIRVRHAKARAKARAVRTVAHDAARRRRELTPTNTVRIVHRALNDSADTSPVTKHAMKVLDHVFDGVKQSSSDTIVDSLLR